MLKLYKKMRLANYKGIWFFICYWTLMIKCVESEENGEVECCGFRLRFRLLHPFTLILNVIITITSPLLCVIFEQNFFSMIKEIWWNKETTILF